jgi:hypothetical protein
MTHEWRLSPKSGLDQMLLQDQARRALQGLRGGGSRPGSRLIVLRSHRLRESEARGAQEKKQFSGPEQDVQKTSPLQITQVLAMETDVERLPGALLDKGSHGSGIKGLGAETAAPGIQAFEPFIATKQKVVQAKILLVQRSNCGFRTRIHSAVSFSIVCIH